MEWWNRKDGVEEVGEPDEFMTVYDTIVSMGAGPQLEACMSPVCMSRLHGVCGGGGRE
jgi:hypothetical protein